MIINKSIGETIKFANSELAKYLKLMGSSEVEIELGLLADFGIEAGKIDPAYDDRLVVSITDGKGYIAGSNSRSVLYGVYAFLEACGCKWIRQGKDGDYIPKCCLLYTSASPGWAQASRPENDSGQYQEYSVHLRWGFRWH